MPENRDESASAPPVTLLGIVAFLIRHWRVIVGVPLASVVIAVAVTLIRQPTYMAESTMLPLTESSGGGALASVASRFGIAVGGANSPGESVEFYSQLLTSRDLLKAAIYSQYAFPRSAAGPDTLRGNLIELFEIDGDTPQARERIAVAMLMDRIATEPDLRAGTIKLRTQAFNPNLAELLNRRLLDLVNTYNVERRQSQARAEREFAERQADEARDSLAAAEAAMESFLVRNRTYQDAPRLAFEAASLDRRIGLYQTLYTSLAQARDQARLSEVRSTPVITVVSAPEGTARKTHRFLLTAIMAAILGGMLGLLVAATVEVLRREAAEMPDVAVQIRNQIKPLSLRSDGRGART